MLHRSVTFSKDSPSSGKVMLVSADQTSRGSSRRARKSCLPPPLLREGSSEPVLFPCRGPRYIGPPGAKSPERNLKAAAWVASRPKEKKEKKIMLSRKQPENSLPALQRKDKRNGTGKENLRLLLVIDQCSIVCQLRKFMGYVPSIMLYNVHCFNYGFWAFPSRPSSRIR